MKIHLTWLAMLISGILSAQVQLVPVTTGLSNLVDIASSGDERIFLVQKNGLILISDSSGTLNPTPFLDIRSRVYSTTLEPGLLSLAFPPDFKQSGVFYVYYNQVNTNDNLISRFRISPNPDVADTSSEQIIINVSSTATHLGGDMAFGKDNFLYIGLGDGGGEGDPSNHAQDSTLFLGKFLRLDVSDLNLAGYHVPPTNPFHGSAYRDEIWSVGFRNPWRWSFDRLTYDKWIGDVGQGTREEVDFEPYWERGGKNYGWRCYEGTATYNTTDCAASALYTAPAHEYLHTSGCSVTGGYIYRGSSYHTLFGKYFYSDWCSPSLRRLIRTGTTFADSSYGNLGLSSGPLCFGEDQWGDILVGISTTMYRLIDPSAHHVAWIWDEDTMHVCAQTAAILQTPAGAGFHYQWFQNGTPFGNDTNVISTNSAADYYVIVQNASGLPQTSSTVHVSFEPVPVVSISGLDTVNCINDPVTNFLINPLGGQLRIDGIPQVIPQFNPAELGTGQHFVEYTYTTSYGCSGSALQTVRVDACLSVNTIPENEIQAYPVPAGDFLVVPMSGKIRIYDASGREIKTDAKQDEENQIVSVKNLVPGFYICTVQSEMTLMSFKWIKK